MTRSAMFVNTSNHDGEDFLIPDWEGKDRRVRPGEAVQISLDGYAVGDVTDLKIANDESGEVKAFYQPVIDGHGARINRQVFPRVKVVFE